MAEFLTDKQMDEFREAFAVIDRDSDGFISVEELELVIRSVIEHPTKEIIQEMMNHVDADGNGTIDFQEFLHMIINTAKANDVELREAFSVFDRDQDGYISTFELMNVMMNLGERLTEEEAEEMIREADVDGNGSLDYDEFVRIMSLSYSSLESKH
ncbi:hypothetical protein M569_09899 [Genlisea aurea]|uniref:EF-hand domain-containing protein n=1 Tax=Genlisea aurea TaxID=192259 RepID=S8CDG1_9LAMI|nr:hypothetical protein M569_09899 [Genlisea aurea]